MTLPLTALSVLYLQNEIDRDLFGKQHDVYRRETNFHPTLSYSIDEQDEDKMFAEQVGIKWKLEIDFDQI